MLLPRRWEDIPRHEQISCYWAVVPDDIDTILDGNDYEIVYVYFDGKWSVMRPGKLQRELLSSFWFLKPIEQPKTIKQTTEDMVFAALERHNWNKRTAANELGVSLKTIYNYINSNKWSEKLFCSQFSKTKKEAEKIASKMRAVGGVGVTITGRRGLWRIRGKINIKVFAKFCVETRFKDENNS